MKGLGWEVTYVSWVDYKKALLEGGGELWESFEEADLVFGGMDFSCDFL
jgi:hypothetical protein